MLIALRDPIVQASGSICTNDVKKLFNLYKVSLETAEKRFAQVVRVVKLILYQGTGLSMYLPFGNGAIIRAVAAGLKEMLLYSKFCYGQKGT